MTTWAAEGSRKGLAQASIHLVHFYMQSQLSLIFLRASWWDPRKQQHCGNISGEGSGEQAEQGVARLITLPFSPLLWILRRKHTLKSKLLVCGPLTKLLLNLMSCELRLKQLLIPEENHWTWKTSNVRASARGSEHKSGGKTKIQKFKKQNSHFLIGETDFIPSYPPVWGQIWIGIYNKLGGSGSCSLMRP